MEVIWAVAMLVAPTVAFYWLAATALGVLVVTAFFVGVFRFVIWGMSGRRW